MNCKIEVPPATAKKQNAGRCVVATVCALVVVAKGKKKRFVRDWKFLYVGRPPLRATCKRASTD